MPPWDQQSQSHQFQYTLAEETIQKYTPRMQEHKDIEIVNPIRNISQLAMLVNILLVFKDASGVEAQSTGRASSVRRRVKIEAR